MKLNFFLRLLGPYRNKIFFLVVLIICNVLFEASGLALLVPFLNILMKQPNTELPKYLEVLGFNQLGDNNLLFIGIAVIFAYFFKSILTIFKKYFTVRVSNKLRQQWSCTAFQNYLHLEFYLMRQKQQGVLVNDISQEPQFASKGLIDLIEMFSNAIMIFALVIFLITLNWRMTLLSLSLIIFLIFLLWSSMSKISHTTGKSRMKVNRQINQLLTEAIKGVKQIKIYSLENNVLDELHEKYNVLIKKLSRFALVNSLPASLGEFGVITLFILFVLTSVYIMKLDVNNLLPTAAVFLLSFLRLFNNASSLLSLRMHVLTYLPSMKLMAEFSTAEYMTSANRSIENKRDYTLMESLKINDVSFNYPEDSAKVLKNINMSLESGKIYSFVGRSGSGKSTLCDIIIGLHKIIDGQILLDNKNITNIPIDKLRKIIGYVSQDSFIFNSSIKDNISLANSTFSDEVILNSLRWVGLDKTIEKLPNGINTVVGDGGFALSGGERQRLAIARGLIRNTPILIFDEATSALDNESETLILNNIKNIKHNKIIIIINHRISTLENVVDYIFFIENGQVAESGSFTELNSFQKKFYELLNFSYKQNE